MNTTDTQPQHGQTVSSPDPGWMTPWRRRANKTRRAFQTVLRPIGRGLAKAGGLAVDGFIAWFQAYVSLTYYVIAAVVGAFFAVTAYTAASAGLAAHLIWSDHYVIFAAWAFGGLLAAIRTWSTDRTATPTANLDDVADRYDDLTDRITEINGKLASLDDRGSDTTAVLEQVVDSLDAIRKQLAQGGAS